MKLTDLASTPVLTKIVLDDADTIEEFGEALDFYTHLPIPLDVFLKFQMRESMDLTSTVAILKDVILDEDGKQVMADGKVLPVTVLLRAVTKLTSELGKSQGRS
jgi:hypothetical protein